jgi:hypothetical protein
MWIGDRKKEVNFSCVLQRVRLGCRGLVSEGPSFETKVVLMPRKCQQHWKQAVRNKN